MEVMLNREDIAELRKSLTITINSAGLRVGGHTFVPWSELRIAEHGELSITIPPKLWELPS